MNMKQFDIFTNIDDKNGEYVGDAMMDLLCLLRMDGVIESDKTPVCGTGDPISFLKDLIATSEVDYKDTLLALLDSIVENGETVFISSDSDETSGEMLDRIVNLLISLSCEDVIKIRNQRYNDVFWIDNTNIFSSYFNTGVASAFPLVISGCTKVFEIFKNSRFHDIDDQRADEVAEIFTKFYEAAPLEAVAFDERPYRKLLCQCAKAGVSVSGWMERAKRCLCNKDCDVRYWMLEHVDSAVADMIISKEGYYMLSLSGDDVDRFETGEEYAELRKYIVSNGYLKDVWNYYCEECDTLFAYYEIDTRKERSQSQTVRFLCFNNITDGINLLKLAFDFDPESENKVYRFVSAETIAEENYLLNMNRYNSYEYNMCQNPVFLKDILTPAAYSVGEIETRPIYINSYIGEPDPSFEKGSINVRLSEGSLDNYTEFVKAEMAFRETGDRKYMTDSALFLRNIWPMMPTWVSCKELGEQGGLVVSASDSKTVRAYKVDLSIVSPWYLAYKLSQATSQFNLRKNKDGVLEDSQLMRMFIDLQSLDEQKKLVEDVISQEIERKKKQVGTVETLFNLSHTIGLPANRIQTLLGNLQDMSVRNPEIYSQIKKVSDNFDYILRVIDSTSKDFSKANDALKEYRILSVLESYISYFSSLPFGIDPKIEKSRINSDVKVKIDRNLFTIMMDNILRNVHRHGFDKKVSSANKEYIELQPVQYEGRDYLLLSVCNNGRKVEDNFTIFDYVSLGRCGKQTGNTGQGGFDIYQIVKKFNGHLGMRCSGEWNFIIDILLPVDACDSDIKLPYAYGTLL